MIWFGTVWDYIFVFVGGVLGAFFVLDGWQGVPNQTDIKKTTRFRNFKYIVIVVFFTFLAKFDKSPDVNIPYIFCHYIVSVVTTSLIVLIGFTFNIMRQEKRRCNLYGESDYLTREFLFYGYRYYQQRIDEFKKNRLKEVAFRLSNLRKTFLPDYCQQIAHTIAAIEVYKNTPTVARKKEIIQEALIAISKIVLTYTRECRLLKNPEDATVTANIMTLKQRSELDHNTLNNRLLYNVDIANADSFLELEFYAFPDGLENFILPVPSKQSRNSRDNILPGAPSAVASNELVVIDNTTEIVYNKGLAQNIIEECKQYFQSKNFCSFACINIRKNDSSIIGVLNVDSNFTNIFGMTKKDKAEVAKLLYPFTCLIGSIL